MNEAEAFIEYRLAHSPRAFAALVASQIDLAYSIALRRVRDAHLADDVTQAVFIILAEKAPMLPPSTNLSGWIFRTTQYVARNALRSIARRRRHEGAYAKTMIDQPDPLVTTEAIAAIDLALTRLGKTDQEAVILKYYRGKSWTEVGHALGLTEEAARKRIHRALARLRVWLPADLTAAPAIILTTHAVRSAPPHLAAAVLQNVAAQAAPHASALALAKGTLLAASQIKIAAVAAVLILTIIPASLAVVHLLSTASVAAAPGPAPQPPGKLPFTISKETTAITSPLHDDGTVDYVAAINARYGRGVTPDNNAFVDWLQIVGTDSAGFNSDQALWKATNGASLFPDPQAKTEFLKLAGAEQTPPNARVWQPFVEFFFKKYSGKSRPPQQGRTTDFESAAVELWTQQDSPDIAEFLNRQDMCLNALDAVADKPNWWMPAVSSNGRTLMLALRPEIVSYQNSGLQCEPISALCARATFRLKGGDFDGFKRDLIAVKRLARRVAAGPTLFERQSGDWIDSQATRSLGAIAGNGVLSAAQCADLIQSLEALEKMPDMSETVDVNERWLNLDLAAVIATGKFDQLSEVARPDGDKRFASIERDAVDWDAVLKEINSAFDDGVTAMREPRLRVMMQNTQSLALRSNRLGEAAGRDLHKLPDETQTAYSHRVAQAIMTIWPTQLAYRIIEEDARRTAMEDAMLGSLLAIAQAHAETRKWPQSAGKLPADIYSQSETDPVQYEVKDNGAVLYSVGPNGIDDGGRNDAKNNWDDIAVGAK